MTDINTRALDRELKRGAAELLILSLLDARPRHGYELSKLIHTRSGGQITFHIDSLTQDLGGVRRRCSTRHRRRTCLTGHNTCARVYRSCASRPHAKPRSSKSSRNISKTVIGS